jgi:ATP adenylyltransferase
MVGVGLAGTIRDPGCPICQKHLGRGPLVGRVIYSDELLHIAHRATGSLGYVFVETQRHVSSLDRLSDDEAEAIGRMTARLARGLRAELDIEHVHSMVAGLAVPHFHEHVFVRHTGTPADVEWSQQWDEAPTGDVEALAVRLRDYLGVPAD